MVRSLPIRPSPTLPLILRAILVLGPRLTLFMVGFIIHRGPCARAEFVNLGHSGLCSLRRFSLGVCDRSGQRGYPAHSSLPPVIKPRVHVGS